MDLREAVDRYANAVSNRDYYDDRGQAEKSRQCGLEAEQVRQCLDALIDAGETARAYLAFSLECDTGNVEHLKHAIYLRERYVQAESKVKATTQQ